MEEENGIAAIIANIEEALNTPIKSSVLDSTATLEGDTYIANEGVLALQIKGQSPESGFIEFIAKQELYKDSPEGKESEIVLALNKPLFIRSMGILLNPEIKILKFEIYANLTICIANLCYSIPENLVSELLTKIDSAF